MSGAQSPPPRGSLGPGKQSNGALLTPAELAARWQVPTSQVYRLARAGRLEAVRIGRYRRFALAAVERFEADGGVDAD